MVSKRASSAAHGPTSIAQTALARDQDVGSEIQPAS